MQALDWSIVLQNEMQRLDSLFRSDELAYLSLTSKIELPIRDRLAFQLHERFRTEANLTVAREWRRFDLAILERKEPVLLVELKAMYSFDVFTSRAATQYPGAIESDARKMAEFTRSNSVRGAGCYTLLLATHPHSAPPSQLDGIVKYSGDIRRYHPIDGDALLEAVSTQFRKHPASAAGELAGGSAFGIAASVYWWLFGPYGYAA